MAKPTEAEAKARAALLDVESYQIFLDLASGSARFFSRTEIRFRCRRPGSTTFADVSASRLNKVVLNDASLDPDVVLSAGRLWLPELEAHNLLTVDAEFSYSRNGRGLVRFEDHSDSGVYVLASCFPTHAPEVFCCFDQLDLRADFTLSVAAPGGWECVSNGAPADRPDAGKRGIWRFAMVPAMKPYELALCAGHYVEVSDSVHNGPMRLSVLSRRVLSETGSARLTWVGGTVQLALRYYERILATPCPYRKCDILLVPGLIPLAAQLPGVMLVNEILFRRMTDAGDHFAALVLTHEVAHLWFGCLVEGRWWDDLWLSEALATYLSYSAADEALGIGSPWAEFAMREQAAAYRADSHSESQPVSSPVDDASDALARPAAITYSKGASAIRQLAALIGDGALLAGLRGYLAKYGGSATALADLIGCWSDASGRDLRGWAVQWLRTPGANTLRMELTSAGDGTVRSATVIQEPPPGLAAERPHTADSPGPLNGLRTHCIAIGVYERAGDRLRRRDLIRAEISVGHTVVPELTGIPVPDALIVNDGDLTFARVRFDNHSLRSLIACGMDVDDPLTEAVCWNAAWDMTTAAELSVSQFVDLVASRIWTGRLPVGIEELLDHVVTGADYYTAAPQRSRLRQRAAAAALEGAKLACPGSRDQRALVAGFINSAWGERQLGVLCSWLDGSSLPPGLSLSLDLRSQILAALSAHGLTTDDDLDAFAAADGTGGQEHRARCRALRPDPVVKEAAWTAALAQGQTPSMALAHARGFWVPGQENITKPFRDRYFNEALPVLGGREFRTARRLAMYLYPATLVEPATIRATDIALERGGAGSGFRAVLLEQREILRQALTARSGATAG